MKEIDSRVKVVLCICAGLIVGFIFLMVDELIGAKGSIRTLTIATMGGSIVGLIINNRSTSGVFWSSLGGFVTGLVIVFMQSGGIKSIL